MIINLNKFINFTKNNKNIVLLMMLFFLFSSFILSFVSVYKSQSNTKIVVFDRDALFKDYYKSLVALNTSSQTPDEFKKILEKKNTFFVTEMISDLNDYQKSHHAIIVKRSSLSAPDIILNSDENITHFIETELKSQGAIA
ncbi:MAG: hypothetical protein NTZ67_08015 [Gammaproteobacteria bacterium]|nr:hypothetical protein [Gammaproteobacteria bacterium]